MLLYLFMCCISLKLFVPVLLRNVLLMVGRLELREIIFIFYNYLFT